jgi:hypothetical protein
MDKLDNDLAKCCFIQNCDDFCRIIGNFEKQKINCFIIDFFVNAMTEKTNKRKV